jgi:hypothetical protein
MPPRTDFLKFGVPTRGKRAVAQQGKRLDLPFHVSDSLGCNTGSGSKEEEDEEQELRGGMERVGGRGADQV